MNQLRREILAMPPQPKEFLNSGVVVIRENIIADTTNDNYTVYTWHESQYTQLQYVELLEREKDLLKAQLQATEERLTMTEQVLNEMLLGGM